MIMRMQVRFMRSLSGLEWEPPDAVTCFDETGQKSPVGLLMLLCLFVLIQMASQTWDDHDRSNRYTCRDFGANYLMTLPDKGNPIIFCNGDNDTFPLWYNQDTE